VTRAALPHYLRANHREASPHRVLVIDTETEPHQVGDDKLHTLALWQARLTLRHGRNIDGETSFDHGGTTAVHLAALVEKLSTSRETLWVLAHNLSFDLAVTRLPVLLLERGWELTQHALASDAPWCRMRKGTRRITFANSASYLPTSVDALGRLLGVRKLPLPDHHDREALRERCRVDVQITSDAIGALMDWWDENQLGNWSLTGPGTGWSAYRHIPMGMNILITPDADAQAFERRGLLAGRREAWRVGRLPEGWYLDLDIAHAHLTAAAHCALPYQRMRAFDSLPVNTDWLTLQSLDIMAEATIETETPRYPVMLKHGIFYPVGRFVTVLAGPELREARRRGELVAIGRGYLYRVGAHMARFGRWLEAELGALRSGAENVVSVALKGWSRSVPGRWASHTSELLTTYADSRPGWWLEHGTWGADRWPVSYFTIGGKQHVLRRDVEGDNSFPAILAWIQSYTRVWIGRLIDLCGDAAVQCNTDGVIVDAEKLARTYGIKLRGTAVQGATAERALAAALTHLDAAIAPATVKVKRTARRVTVLGAQHVILDDERRLSGVPREAAELSDLKFRYWSWPSLAGQMLEGNARGFTQKRVDADLSRVPVNRWVLQSGRTAPVRAHIGQSGTTELLPYSTAQGALPGLAAGRAQHLDLAATLAQGGEESTPAALAAPTPLPELSAPLALAH